MSVVGGLDSATSGLTHVDHHGRDRPGAEGAAAVGPSLAAGGGGAAAGGAKRGCAAKCDWWGDLRNLVPRQGRKVSVVMSFSEAVAEGGA